MRFNVRTTTPDKWETREIHYFAWLPVNIRGEIRWLETVHIEQFWGFGEWVNDKFLNN